jgi:sporulation integral membrane protein YlbJ
MNSRALPATLMVVTALVCFMVLDPKTTLEASQNGVKLWFNTVLPALFPFFVAADLLVNLGAVHFLGILLEPVMRPLFRLPGTSSFVVAMGFTSGFPVGAVLTKKLWDEKMLTTEEAERLVSFTNNSSPLFILGVVGIGLFQNAPIGYLLALSHYLSNLLVGIIAGFKQPRKAAVPTPANLLSRAIAELVRHHRQNPKNPGTLLGDAVRTGITNILAIGGFIIIFSVLTSALTVCGFTDWLARLIQVIGFTYDSATGLGVGLFEMTIGSKAIAASQGPLLEKLIAISAVLAWSGFSIQAQVMSIISSTPIRYAYYLKARLLQTVLSAALTYAGFRMAMPLFTGPASQFPPLIKTMPTVADFFTAGWLGILIASALLVILALAVVLRNLMASENAP